MGLLAQLEDSPTGEPVDPAIIAGVLGIDLGAIQQLGLSLPELTQVGAAVAAQPPAQRQQLAAAPIDPAVLVALLAGSGDPAELGSGAIGALINGLLGSLSDLRLTVSPELTVNLGELLGELDPDGLGPVVADEANAAVFALLLSAFIGANPVLTEQLLDNPLLEPGLQRAAEPTARPERVARRCGSRSAPARAAPTAPGPADLSRSGCTRTDAAGPPTLRRRSPRSRRRT